MRLKSTSLTFSPNSLKSSNSSTSSNSSNLLTGSTQWVSALTSFTNTNDTYAAFTDCPWTSSPLSMTPSLSPTSSYQCNRNAYAITSSDLDARATAPKDRRVANDGVPGQIKPYGYTQGRSGQVSTGRPVLVHGPEQKIGAKVCQQGQIRQPVEPQLREKVRNGVAGADSTENKGADKAAPAVLTLTFAARFGAYFGQLTAQLCHFAQQLKCHFVDTLNTGVRQLKQLYAKAFFSDTASSSETVWWVKYPSPQRLA